MKEINNVEELEVGKLYHLISKPSNRYAGLCRLFADMGSDGQNFPYFMNRQWAYTGNEVALQL